MRWIDNHCHVGIHFPDQGAVADDPDVAAVIDDARAAGVERLINVGTDVETSATALAVAAAYDDVWGTAGVHPHDAKDIVAADGTVDLSGIVGLLDHPSIVAVGECGLDYHYNHSPAEQQQAAFRAQIALAKEHDLALVIHTREAWEETFAILDDEGVPERTVFHCFTGGPDEARAGLDRGIRLSFSGIITYKTADDLRAAAAICPLDHLLVETDSPYLTPVPHRGTKNKPGWVPLVGAAVAAATGDAAEAVAEASWQNAIDLYRLPAA
jgi:TatD DNase family protein